jgi:hypothetical protein
MAKTANIAVLRAELEGIEPLIWRRVAVRTTMSLLDVHAVIQAAMGWLDCHLWELEADDRKYAIQVPSEPEWNERYEDAGRVTLASLVESGVRGMSYVYDMGDFWEHSVIVEKVSPPLSDARYPQFLGGERRCPPEDCGGPPGYFEFIKNISSKQRRVRDDALRWYGGPYDPNDIGASTIAAAFERISRRGARR